MSGRQGEDGEARGRHGRERRDATRTLTGVAGTCGARVRAMWGHGRGLLAPRIRMRDGALWPRGWAPERGGDVDAPPRRSRGRVCSCARDVTDDVADAVGSTWVRLRNIKWKNTPGRVCECATAHAGPRRGPTIKTSLVRTAHSPFDTGHTRTRTIVIAPRRTVWWSHTSAAATPAGLDRTRVDSTLRAVIRVGCHTRRTIDAQDLV